MRTKHLVGILVLLVLAVPTSPAHAGGVVDVCDEAHLRSALWLGGVVTFNCSGTISLSSTITIAMDTTIDSTGQNITLSGNHAVRVLEVVPGSTLNLIALTIADGKTIYACGGIDNNGGTVNVTNCTFNDNKADYSGGAICNSYTGWLTVSGSTFTRNYSRTNGGGIANTGTATVNNSTFSGNNADVGGGGGMANWGTLTVTNTTLAGNRSSSGPGGIYNVAGTVTLRNSIVASNSPDVNCSGAITDGGGNLSYPDTTCPGINRNPRLGPLQDNGGPTHTMTLNPGSAALDAANDAICAAPPVNSLDQRGITRPQGVHCDIGAVEQESHPSLLPRIWLPLARAQ